MTTPPEIWLQRAKDYLADGNIYQAVKCINEAMFLIEEKKKDVGDVAC